MSSESMSSKVSSEECLELKNIKYKTMLMSGASIQETKSDLDMSNLEKFLARADTRLATSAYIASSQFTLADIALGYCLYRYYDIDVARSEMPNLRRYYDLLCKRPAFKRNVMVSYDELRA